MPGAKAGLQVVTCFRRQRRLLKFLFMAIDVAFISRHCFHLAWISSGWEQKAKLLCSVRKCSDEPLGLCSCFYLRGLMHSLYLRCAWDVCDDSGWQVAPWGHVGVVFRGECRWRWGQCRLIFRSSVQNPECAAFFSFYTNSRLGKLPNLEIKREKNTFYIYTVVFITYSYVKPWVCTKITTVNTEKMCMYWFPMMSAVNSNIPITSARAPSTTTSKMTTGAISTLVAAKNIKHKNYYLY